MRIRVPGRFTAALAILVAVLCLLPSSTQVAVAKPIGWDGLGPPPPPPSGDNDGVVLKSTSLKPSVGNGTETWGAGSATDVTATTGRRYVLSGLRGYFAVVRLDYWLFWAR